MNNRHGRFLECLDYVHPTDLHFKFDEFLPATLVRDIVAELRIVQQQNPDLWKTDVCVGLWNRVIKVKLIDLGYIPPAAVVPLLTDVLFCRSFRFRKAAVLEEIGGIEKPLLNLPTLRKAHRISVRQLREWADVGRVETPLLNIPIVDNAHRIAVRQSPGWTWRQTAYELFRWLHDGDGKEFYGAVLLLESIDDLFRMLVEVSESSSEHCCNEC